MKFSALLLITGIASATPSLAATRKVYFASNTQSHLPRDDNTNAIPQRVHLSCTVTVRNMSAVEQRITGFNFFANAAVPDSAALQPTVYKNQKGNAASTNNAPDVLFMHFDGNASSVATNYTTVSTGSPIVLAARGSARDSVVARQSVAFQIKNVNFDDGSAVPARLNVMLNCLGDITVLDATTPGFVIASGAAEAVADAPNNPTIRYGNSGFESSNPGNTSGIMADGNDTGHLSETYCDTITGVPGCLPADTNMWVTGPGANTDAYLRHIPASNYWGPPSAYDINNYGSNSGSFTSTTANITGGECGETTDTTTGRTYLPPGGYTETPTPAFTPATNMDLAAFPQHIVSVPFLVNGGKPF